MEKLQGFIDSCRLEQIKIKETKLEAYAKDYSKLRPQKPKFVCLPKSHQDVLFLINQANKFDIPICTRGLGTGKSGGAIPQQHGVVLSLELMNTIIDMDEENRVIVVEPGVKTLEIHQYVEKQGLFYPPDPSSLDICSIGGNVAENAGGARALKYGVTRNYVLGLKGVFGDGRSFSFGGSIHKDVSGYDMQSLLVGSEGTLAIITEVTLKLIAKPKHSYLILLSNNNHKQSLDMLLRIQQLGIQPASCELFDAFCYEAAKRFNKNHTLQMSGNSFLLIELDGFDENSIFGQVSSIKSLSEKNGSSFLFEKDREKQAKWWAFRRSMSEALSSVSITKRSEDIVVPIKKLAFFLEFLNDLSQEKEIYILGYGHAGDGNVHVNVLLLEDFKQWNTLVNHYIKLILSKAVELGGSITGEHGIGLTKKAYLPLMFDENQIKQFRAIKNICDPNGILNPDKMFV